MVSKYAFNFLIIYYFKLRIYTHFQIYCQYNFIRISGRICNM